jgi:hypothetical protein
MDAANVSNAMAVVKNPSPSTLDKANSLIDTAGNVAGLATDIYGLGGSQGWWGGGDQGGGGGSAYGDWGNINQNNSA